ncbi:MAG TPA: hypothetical protein VFF00_00535 [Candidatus Elarobacter sp.]|nr:hypothetical protein [Candidatus Elarobacter sp.]
MAACAALLFAGCGAGQQGAVPAQQQSGASTSRAIKSTKQLNFVPFYTIAASRGTSMALGIKQWNFFTWNDNSKAVTVIGVASDDSVVWEADVSPQAGGAAQLITNNGTNIYAAQNGALTIYSNHGAQDNPYASALNSDTNGTSGGGTGLGGGGPQPMSAFRKAQSTAGLWSGITSVVAGIGAAICIAAEPCGAAVAAGLALVSAASGAFTIYDNIPNPNDFNQPGLLSPGTSVQFAPQPGSNGYVGGGSGGGSGGTVTKVCVYDDTGARLQCWYTFY